MGLVENLGNNLVTNNEAEIIKDNHVSEHIDHDESVAYESWAQYEKAVDAGVEPVPYDNTKVEAIRRIKKSKENFIEELNSIDEETVSKNIIAGLGVKKKYSFNVDKALDSIDLSFPRYKPSRDSIDFFNIIRLVLGEEPEIESSIMHYFLVDLFFGNVTQDMFPFSKEVRDNIRINPKKIALIAARRSAKSTILTAFMPIYSAITGRIPNFGEIMFWVSFGDSQKSGAKVQANTIRDICEDSDFCLAHFEKMRFTDEECEFTRAQLSGENKKEKARSFMFKVKGAAGGSVRGIRYRTQRPQILSFDDIIKSESDAKSTVIMNRLRSMIYSDAESAMGKKGKIVLVNTPFTKSDPIYNALENGVWTPMCIPMCEKIDENTTKEEFVGSWEAMNDYEWAIERYADALYGDTLREFNQELQLRIASEEDKLIKAHQIQWYDRRTIEKNLRDYNVIITTDLTASNNTKSGDFSGIAAWAISSNDDWFLLDITVRRMGIEEQYTPIFNYVQRYAKVTGRAPLVFIETNGQQQLNFSSLRKSMREKNIFFSFGRQKGKPYGTEGFSRTGASKHDHFMRVHPMFQNHKIFFPTQIKDTPDMREVLEELNYITYSIIASDHDDALDTISAIGLCEVTLPSISVAEAEIERRVELGNGIFVSVTDDYDDDIDSGAGY